jgi:hypothetical protein
LDYVDQQLQQIQQNQPDLWNQMKKQQGLGATIAGDRGVMEYYLSGVQPKLSTHETKSQAQLDKEAADLKITESKASHIEEDWNLDRLKTLTTIEANKASRFKDLALAKKANGEGFGSKNLSDYGISNDGFHFGDEITVPVKTPKGETSYVKATKFTWSPQGKLMVEGIPGKTDAMTNVFVPTGGVQLYPADNNTLASFKMSVGNMGKDKQANISTGYALFNSLPRPKTNEELFSGLGIKKVPNTIDELMSSLNAPKAQGSSQKQVESKSNPAPTKVTPSGKFISKASLDKMYGEGKPFPTKEAAINAAVNVYGHTVEGVND